MPGAPQTRLSARLCITIAAAGSLLISGPLAPPAGAQNAGPAKKKQELETKRKLLEKERKKEAKLQKDLAALAAERVRITEESKNLAAKTQDAERQLSDAERKLADYGRQEETLRKALTRRYGKISKLLSVLQRMGRNPPPVMITKREDALKMVRSAMLIASAFPEMRSEAVTLSSKLQELVRVMDGIRDESAKSKAYAATLRERRKELSALMETKRQLHSERQAELQSVREAAAKIAGSVEKLNDLIAKADEAVSKQTELGRYNDTSPEPAPKGDDIAALPSSPGAIELSPGTDGTRAQPLQPGIAFAKAKSKLPKPAAGRRILSFGEKTQYGTKSKGIVIETRVYAQVTSPCDGWIVFAGEFRSYGRVLIINPGGGYHVLMAGLSQIDVTTGQFVVAGEPVATMSGGIPTSEQKAQAPVLYIEFRKDGDPVDPDPWWVATKQVDSQKKVQG